MYRIVCFLCALLLCLMLTGCQQTTPPPAATPALEPQPEPVIPQEPPIPDAPESPEPEAPVPEEPEQPQVADIIFTPGTNDSTWSEYAVIEGLDAQGQVLWTYTTGEYEMAQLSRVHEIGLTEDRYYFCEDGAVVALNPNTGELLWKNSDFGGSAMNDAARLVSEDGTVYLCGYLGPDFFAVDAEGNTLCSIGSFDTDYYWPYALEKTGSELAITFEGGPEGYVDGKACTVHVNLEDFSYTLEPGAG